MDTPWDKMFKLQGNEDPFDIMRLFSRMPRGARYTLKRLDRELVRKRRHLDEVYDVTGGPQPGIYIFEATTRFRREVYENTAKYSLELLLDHGKPIYSHMVILTSEGFPAGGPKTWGGQYGVIGVKVKPRVVPVWRLPARLTLSQGPRSLPWTALVNSSEEQRDRAEELLYQHGDRELMSRYALLMGLRFGDNKNELERMDEMLTREIIEESAFYKKILAKGEERGKAAGIAQGIAQGIAEGRRVQLQSLIRAKFGKLPASALAKIRKADVATLDRWALQVLTARTIEEGLS